MSELRELYQQVILDHNRKPHNFGPLDTANRHQEGFNPLCGDHLHVYLRLSADDVIEDIHFDGSGCAISKASASLMTQLLKGCTADEARQRFAGFHAMVTADNDAPVDLEAAGKLAVFSGVREFPMRVKCATLAWHTMKSALDSEATDPITTE
ncbi:MAG: SUF system NifU family Fe-S cluster assembly protein [bacterium]|nr:SUF system NifU family Fe-S cluster assembly protein [bacterium]